MDGTAEFSKTIDKLQAEIDAVNAHCDALYPQIDQIAKELEGLRATLKAGNIIPQ
jgi:hypothetical protein